MSSFITVALGWLSFRFLKGSEFYSTLTKLRSSMSLTLPLKSCVPEQSEHTASKIIHQERAHKVTVVDSPACLRKEIYLESVKSMTRGRDVCSRLFYINTYMDKITEMRTHTYVQRKELC